MRLKKIVIPVFVVLLMCTLSCKTTSVDSHEKYNIIADTIRVSTLGKQMTFVRDYVPLYSNIAHRGTTYWAPEETESSWRWARHMGADYLEADIQCSKDKVLLAVHDNIFDWKQDTASSGTWHHVRTRRSRGPEDKTAAKIV